MPCVSCAPLQYPPLKDLFLFRCNEKIIAFPFLLGLLKKIHKENLASEYLG